MELAGLEHNPDNPRSREDLEDAIGELVNTYGIEPVEEVLNAKRSQKDQENTTEHLH